MDYVNEFVNLGVTKPLGKNQNPFDVLSNEDVVSSDRFYKEHVTLDFLLNT